MSFELIRVHGMSPANSIYGEPIELPDGRQLEVIKEVDDDGNTDVVCVSIDGVSARYPVVDVEEIGYGNLDAGIMAVVDGAKRSEAFEPGQFRPIDPFQS